ncbi:MBL fold metallo-hydrolase [Parendozoicomonas haliclonae]|uniref:Ribonuclease Z n=1 Tax=Parendozoicomonas haliclonae TaxID=1960125 RepID=A0A1X7AH36_9GAMM|nr:MBL fold metallo-hydrolase [Parendozoicomonas haliclonae]SMA39629.1 ribonuclease Z [Parendozoicomonas haliclonae]
MKVRVLGCGEASDPVHPNSSVVVEQGDWRLLIDLGYSAAQKLYSCYPDGEAIDAIYFTHAHPDHCFGLGPYLIRLNDRQRKKPLQIICNPDSQERLKHLVEVSFWGIDKPWSFDLVWITTDEISSVGPFQLTFASTTHSVTNQSILVQGEQALFYSGDGLVGQEGEQLINKADMAFIETFALTEQAGGQWHGNLPHTLKLVDANPDTTFCLYHIREDFRENMMLQVEGIERVLVPESGDLFDMASGEITHDA